MFGVPEIVFLVYPLLRRYTKQKHMCLLKRNFEVFKTKDPPRPLAVIIFIHTVKTPFIQHEENNSQSSVTTHKNRILFDCIQVT